MRYQKRKRNKYTYEIICLSLLLTSQLLINYFPSEVIGILLILPAAISSLLFAIRKAGTLPRAKLKMCVLWLWIFGFHLLLLLYGITAPLECDYSLKLHIFNLFTIIILTLITLKHIEHIEMIVTPAFGMAICIISLYILYLEKNNIPNIIKGYRLGNEIKLNPNTIAMTIVLLLPPIVKRLFVVKKLKEKVTLIGIILLSVTMILFCGSKKAIFSLFLIFLIAALFYKKTNLKQSVKALVVVGIIIWSLGNVDFMYNTIGKRIVLMYEVISKGAYTTDTSTGERFLYIIKALQMSTEKPIFGHGFNTFKSLSGYGLYSHCNFTELLFSFGIIGFLIYYSIPICAAIRTYKQKKSNLICIMYLPMALVFDIGAVNYYDNPLLFFSYAFVWISTIWSIRPIEVFAETQEYA